VAQGFALAAVRGHPGERYLLGGVNVTFRDLFAGAARAAGQRRPSLPLPSGPTRLAGRMLERMLKRPPFDEASALLMSRYWYYDSSKARRELAFTTRPLEQTLADAVADLRARGLIR
jgi:dihydroflavonol-4-reductase